MCNRMEIQIIQHLHNNINYTTLSMLEKKRLYQYLLQIKQCKKQGSKSSHKLMMSRSLQVEKFNYVLVYVHYTYGFSNTFFQFTFTSVIGNIKIRTSTWDFACLYDCIYVKIFSISPIVPYCICSLFTSLKGSSSHEWRMLCQLYTSVPWKVGIYWLAAAVVNDLVTVLCQCYSQNHKTTWGKFLVLP